MSNLVAVTVVGIDRPGIVAAISKVLYDRGCNLEDVSSTILRGHFSMMLLVHIPPSVEPGTLEGELDEAGKALGLTVTVRAVEETTSEVPAPTHMVSVYGADKPGIVYRVTDALARLGVNITDLNSRLIGDEDDPVYALQIEVQAAPSCDLDQVLPPLREELGVDLSVHQIQADVL